MYFICLVWNHLTEYFHSCQQFFCCLFYMIYLHTIIIWFSLFLIFSHPISSFSSQNHTEILKMSADILLLFLTLIIPVPASMLHCEEWFILQEIIDVYPPFFLSEVWPDIFLEFCQMIFWHIISTRILFIWIICNKMLPNI